jgi:micrococcal nuclease
VVHVVDGDTFDVATGAGTERIRVIGIDTPEVHDGVECFGQAAAAEAERLLDGQSVALAADPTQDDVDRYGRLLRHVGLPDGSDFGDVMIAAGNAFEYTYDAPYQGQAEYQAAERRAADAGLGLWSVETCGGERTAAPQPAPAPAPVPVTTSVAPSAAEEPAGGDCDIKGNINKDDEKIYHQPGQRYYDETKIDESKGERWFCSAAEAEAAGWRAAKV